ncbi:32b4a832-64f7-4e37-8c6c-73ab32dd8026 [Sclerotinia trifoliorum]|uniref:32b4a832-64f7-4e37-8c6c-73ab32dd8026 n=1 Tax=Sclerotinia trifoliorum TaxID=28548 RepID=A0A8H2VP90_9HELO|nr:32b4a832-64f7-4e37-8c6c-73ab32dd8026 [Sclerotinia trifoliorum]
MQRYGSSILLEFPFYIISPLPTFFLFQMTGSRRQLSPTDRHRASMIHLAISLMNFSQISKTKYRRHPGPRRYFWRDFCGSAEV